MKFTRQQIGLTCPSLLQSGKNRSISSHGDPNNQNVFSCKVEDMENFTAQFLSDGLCKSQACV